MSGSGPTIFALQADSAWFVIVVVSLVTLPAVLVLRRIIDRPGGLASGILLILPLVLPLVAAVLYGNPVLPEVAVLRPALQAVLEEPSSAEHLVFLRAGRVVIPYALAASTGPWLLVVGGAATVFMLVRRALGMITMRRLIRDCVPPAGDAIGQVVCRLSRAAGLKAVPDVLVLPRGTTGAFAVPGGGGRILVSRELIEDLEPRELEAALAHEVAHLRARDVRVVAIAGWLRDVSAWNPFAHVAFRRLQVDRELEADRQAAALTGDPLAVASSLIKMCELMRRRPGLSAPATALGFGRAQGRVARRVHNLLAVADGHSVAAPAGALPYAAAATLAVALAFQVGMHVSTGDGARAVALVWGTPKATRTHVWTPEVDPWEHKRRAKRGGNTRRREESAPPKVHLRLRALEALQASPAVAEKHLYLWAKTVDWVARGPSTRGSTLSSESSWEVRPLLGEPPVGSLNVYSVERLSFPMRALRP